MKKLLITLLIGAPLLISCSNNNQNVVQGYVEGELIYEASSQSGAVENLEVHRGEMVKANQVLFKLDDQPQTDQLAQAQGQLASAQFTLKDIEIGERPDEIKEIEADIAATQAAIIYYKAQTKRLKNLSSLDYASKSDYDEAVYQYGVSVANLAKLQAELNLAKQGQRENQIAAQKKTVEADAANVAVAQWNETQKTLSTPDAGLIFDTYYKPGEWVSAGQPIVSLQTPENVRVIFFVSETQLGKIQVGNKVAFQCDSCKNPTTATISYISNEAEYTPPVIYSEAMREKLVYEVKATIANKVALQYHPGQPVDVAIDGKF